MGWMRLIVVGTVLAAASSAAMAFQEQRQIQGAPAAQPAPSQSQPGVKAEGDLTVAPASRSTGGTEVRIPGLGMLGILPKMDFGLDLLYGATDQQRSPATPADKPEENDGLAIRGSIKHKF